MSVVIIIVKHYNYYILSSFIFILAIFNRFSSYTSLSSFLLSFLTFRLRSSNLTTLYSLFDFTLYTFLYIIRLKFLNYLDFLTLQLEIILGSLLVYGDYVLHSSVTRETHTSYFPSSSSLFTSLFLILLIDLPHWTF